MIMHKKSTVQCFGICHMAGNIGMELNLAVGKLTVCHQILFHQCFILVLYVYVVTDSYIANVKSVII